VAVTVTRSGGVASAVSVQYATRAGTATAPSDYVASSGTLVFGAGQTSASIVVQVQGDAVAEGNEALEIALSNPSPGATVGAPSSTRLWIIEPPV
jgi:hypothetical protein